MLPQFFFNYNLQTLTLYLAYPTYLRAPFLTSGTKTKSGLAYYNRYLKGKQICLYLEARRG
jgi:hypothetical protein